MYKKVFKNQRKFITEYHIYAKKLPYIPKLIKVDIDEPFLLIEEQGKSLQDKYNSRERIKYYPKIKELSEQFYNDTGFYHNDLRWKNILENDDGKLFLIDFEFAHPLFTDTLKKAPDYTKYFYHQYDAEYIDYKALNKLKPKQNMQVFLNNGETFDDIIFDD